MTGSPGTAAPRRPGACALQVQRPGRPRGTTRFFEHDPHHRGDHCCCNASLEYEPAVSRLALSGLICVDGQNQARCPAGRRKWLNRPSRRWPKTPLANTCVSGCRIRGLSRNWSSSSCARVRSKTETWQVLGLRAVRREQTARFCAAAALARDHPARSPTSFLTFNSTRSGSRYRRSVVLSRPGRGTSGLWRRRSRGTCTAASTTRRWAGAWRPSLFTLSELVILAGRPRAASPTTRRLPASVRPRKYDPARALSIDVGPK